MPRYLNHLEIRMALTHAQSADDRLCVITAVVGHLEFPQIQKALKRIFDAYQILRCSLHFDSTTDNFYLQENVNFNQITTQEITIHEEQAWRNIAHERNQQRFGVTNNLWEFTLIKLDKNLSSKPLNYLVFGFHHAIIDGISAAQLVDTFLSLYVTPRMELQNRTILNAAPLLYPNKTLITGSNINNSKQASITQFAKNVPIIKRSVQHFFVSFTLTPLQAFCKNNQVSINSLLTTLLIISAFDYKKLHSQAPEIALATCVDLRKRIPENSSTAQDVGLLFNSFVEHFFENELPNDFAQQAKWVHKRITASVTQHAQPPADITSVAQADTCFEVTQQANSDRFCVNIDSSNLGLLNLKKTYGNTIRTEAFFFFVNQTLGFAQLLLCAAGLGDNIYANISSISPIQNPNETKQFTQLWLQAMHEYIPEFELIKEWTEKDFANVAEECAAQSPRVRM